ncbi:MAG: serine hydrolase [Synergistaceae bacterium]|nr:serine hydrolase [Synergistaceae bacterium]
MIKPLRITLLFIVLALSAGTAYSDWQVSAEFPDWQGRTDDTLAMNSMISFKFWHGQGEITVAPSKSAKSFRLFVNDKELGTSGMTGGKTYHLSIADAVKDGMNTLHVSGIRPSGAKVKVMIPYPEILPGTLEESGINPKTLELISDIISADIAEGFTSAQLAVVRHGRLVYESSWGKLNASDPESSSVDSMTMYDLASVTKMFGLNYAVQKLLTDGRMNLDTPVYKILGDGYLNATLSLRYGKGTKANASDMRKWKARIRIRDLLNHEAGYPPEIQYQNANYDLHALKHNPKAVNVLCSYTRADTLKALMKTPLMYEPGTKRIYSDIDYMLMCFIVERVSGVRLDDYLRENFTRPMGLSRISYNPLSNDYTVNDCAATELNGNTFDGEEIFPRVRRYTLQGEVHDGKAWYSMEGVSGHAGLFASASDLARLASLMLTGGSGRHKYFSRTVMDMFMSPQSALSGNWGIGWWREGEMRRAYYFGTQSSSFTIGHQGWTGTLAMIDPERDLVVVYLTNKINSPVVKPLRKTKIFAGNWYTSATLGFVPQILSMGLDSDADITDELRALTLDMAEGSLRLIPKGAGRKHPAVRNAASKIAVFRKWNADDDSVRELEKRLP